LQGKKKKSFFTIRFILELIREEEDKDCGGTKASLKREKWKEKKKIKERESIKQIIHA
jgi:hypothetical protein